MRVLLLILLITCNAVSATGQTQPCRALYTDSKGTTCADKPDDPPSSSELFARLAVDGALPFTLRGWRVDFTGGFSYSTDDCSPRGETWHIKAQRPNTKYILEWKARQTYCYDRSLSLERVTGTEAAKDVAPVSLDDYETLTQDKPDFTIWDIRKGVLLGGESQMTSFSFGGGTESVSVEMRPVKGGSGWTYYLSQDKDGTLHLKPITMTKTTYQPKKKR